MHTQFSIGYYEFHIESLDFFEHPERKEVTGCTDWLGIDSATFGLYVARCSYNLGWGVNIMVRECSRGSVKPPNYFFESTCIRFHIVCEGS